MERLANLALFLVIISIAFAMNLQKKSTGLRAPFTDEEPVVLTLNETANSNDYANPFRLELANAEIFGASSCAKQ